MNKMISLVIPIRNEEFYIKDCIESIINFDYPKKFLEVIFIDGKSDDATLKILGHYVERFPYIKILENNKKVTPVALNIGIREAVGDYICRLDVHAVYPSNYLSNLLEWSQRLDADNVGAICITGIKSNTNTAKSIQFIMSDKFGVGNSLFRVGVKIPVEVDTVPFGFYKKEVFDKIGFYDERLIRTQDLEINKRLKEKNGKIYLIPSVKLIYFPRENYKEFFQNRFETGRWVILSLFITNNFKNIAIRHLIPLLFVLSLLLSFVFGFIYAEFFYLFLFIILTYSLTLFLRVLFIKKNMFLALNILLAYFVLHFSYGIGSLKGALEIFTKGKK